MWGSASFTYDPLDNLRSFNQGSRQYRYVYSPSTWRLDRINRSSGSLVWSFSHDNRGNQTRRGSQDRVFDRANRITQINNENYEYDGHGRRSVAWRSDGTAKVEAYTLDGKLGYITDNRLGGGTSPIYLAGTKVGEDFFNWTSGVRTRTYHHGDMLGSSVAETNTSRMVVQRTEFAAYGEPLNRTVDGQGYTGHVHDDATGLVYAQQRYYDPVVGRFLSGDPMEVDSTSGWNFNRYAYANNNPYSFTDPDGRAALICLVPAGPMQACSAAAVATAKVAASVGTAVAGLVLGAAVYNEIGSAKSPPAPGELVGEQDDRSGTKGKRHNSGPLSPEHGGTGNAESDFDQLTGGESSPASEGSSSPSGAQVGENGIIYRPETDSSGPRIDIPASDGKPHETLHYPKPTPSPHRQPGQ